MNDSLELKWSLEQKIKIIEENCDNVEHFKFLNKVRANLEKIPVYAYMTCFSSKNDLLSQWRAYGDDGKGVAIGFNLIKESLNGLKFDMPIFLNGLDESYKGSFDVVYDDIGSLIDTPMDYYPRAFKEFFTSPKIEDKARSFAEHLLGLSIVSKNPAFKEEKESRIMYLSFKENGSCLVDSNSDFKFKSSNGIITSYLEYKFQKESIFEIVLGPKSIVDRTELDLFLKCNGYNNINIKNSSASYR
jgi:hypothetical protein